MKGMHLQPPLPIFAPLLSRNYYDRHVICSTFAELLASRPDVHAHRTYIYEAVASGNIPSAVAMQVGASCRSDKIGMHASAENRGGDSWAPTPQQPEAVAMRVQARATHMPQTSMACVSQRLSGELSFK